MRAANAVRNATEARTQGKDVLNVARTRSDGYVDSSPRHTAAPTARTQTDLDNILGHCGFSELSIVAKRQMANGVGAYGKRERTEKEHPWMATTTLSAAKMDDGKSFGKKVGHMVLGFEKRDIWSLDPATKAKSKSEEETPRDLLTKAAHNYRADPVGIALMTEKAIKSIGVKPDRREVLAVTAKAMAYRKENNGSKKRVRFQNDGMNKAVRECLEQYASLR
jgi:hypothetical protein